MDINNLDKTQKEYKDIKDQLQRLQGEENQLLQEKDQILSLLKENGFNTKEELEVKLAGLESDINSLIKEIELNLC